MKLLEVAIFTDNVEETASFYKALGGHSAYEHEGIAVILFENVKVLLHKRYEPQEGELPCEDHIAFGVEYVDAEASRLEVLGVRVQYGPADYDWGRSAYLRDPAGKLVELSQLDNPHRTNTI
jgi:catechol 2,3-dioxygenase-like lactoylglutathione lyase family enzyme